MSGEETRLYVATVLVAAESAEEASHALLWAIGQAEQSTPLRVGAAMGAGEVTVREATDAEYVAESHHRGDTDHIPPDVWARLHREGGPA